jgi:hypothetical protein
MKVQSYTYGELPHAEDILPALYELMESDGSLKETPLSVAASPNEQAIWGGWEGLKKALTRSLTSGTFLDSQFYAVESRSPTGLLKILPIYFCSEVGGSFAPKLVACKSLTRIACGWVTDAPFQIPQSSEHGDHHLDVQTGMTAMLTKILTQRTPRSATPVQSCSLIRSRLITVNLVHPFQHPRGPHGPGLTCRTGTCTKVRGGEDVSPSRVIIRLADLSV